MFALVVRFDLHDQAAADAFDVTVSELVAQIVKHEPGTLVYSTHRVADAPLSRLFYEVYRDREAFEEHERQPHTRAFLDNRNEYVASARVEFLNDGPAKGLPA